MQWQGLSHTPVAKIKSPTKTKSRVCKDQVNMKGEGEGEDAKWVTHYSNDHQILLIGEGDFSFSLSLANSFGSAANIVATSLDSYGDVTKKYKDAKSNLDELQKLGAYLLHEVDATRMKFHSDLKMRRFDRVIFNFPHAGFHRKEDNLLMIKMHKDLVFGFFKNASYMLRANGEIHVNHKTTAPFSNWNIEKLALQSSLTLIECVDFKKEDYPGYNNKRGDSYRCDEPFPLGKCSTFKFIYNHRAGRNRERSNTVVPRQQTNLSCQEICEIQDAVELLPTPVDLDYYHETSHIPKINETMFGLSSRYAPISRDYSNNMAVHGRAAPSASYYAHGMSIGSQISLQPMESLQSLQPRPTSTDVRYSLTDHVRTMDILPSSLSARNEGYQVFGCSSTYLREALCRTTQRESYPFDRVRPNFGGSSNYLQEELCRTTQRGSYSFDKVRPNFGGSSNYLQEELCRTTQRGSYSFDRVRSDFGGSSNYWQEALPSRTVQRASCSFDRVRSDFERYIAEVPRRTLNDDIFLQNELHPMSILMSERRMFVGY